MHNAGYFLSWYRGIVELRKRHSRVLFRNIWWGGEKCIHEKIQTTPTSYTM